MPNVSFNCEVCGVLVARYQPPQKRARFCSGRCSGKSWLGKPKSPEHAAKLARWGDAHHAWKADAVDPREGRSRALRLFRKIGPCVKCGAEKSERHHIDGNPLNNSKSNIEPLCRKCHLNVPEHMAQSIKNILNAQPLGVAARWSVCPTYRRQS